MHTNVIYNFLRDDRRIFWFTLVLLLFAISAYAYFLSISVFSVVSRKSAERQADKIHTQISDLETSYATLNKEISLQLATTRGFVSVENPSYVTHDDAQKPFSMRLPERE